MTTTKHLFLTGVALAAFGLTSTAAMAASDTSPYHDGARTNDARSAFTDGANTTADSRDPFTSGAHKATGKRDAYTDGAKSASQGHSRHSASVKKRSPYTDGAHRGSATKA